MVDLCQWFNCSSHEEEHPACFRMPPAAWQLCSVPSYGLCLLLAATWGVWELYFFFTLLPILPWQQLGNAHFRAHRQGLVSHWSEVCGDVLPIEKEGIILQTGSHMQIQQLARQHVPLFLLLREVGDVWWLRFCCFKMPERMVGLQVRPWWAPVSSMKQLEHLWHIIHSGASLETRHCCV